METSKVKEIFSFFGSELWDMTQQFFVISVLVALLSILVTQAIKKSDEDVFLTIEMKNVTLWFINLFLIIAISVMVVLVFDGQNGLSNTVMFIVLVIGLSWALSIILYPCVKYIFEAIEILSYKFKIWKENHKILFKKTQVLSKEIEKELILLDIEKEEDNEV